VDLLYHESTFLEEHADRAKKTYHSTAKQAAEMAKKTNAKQVLLGHFSARYSDLDLFLNEAEPIFKNKNKITIITPSYRTTNLEKIKNSILFDYVNEWIIVYDGKKIHENPGLFEKENNKIKEYVHNGDGISGNPQRNYALTKITNKDTYIYYLDDDNIIHPDLYNLLDFIDNTIYTFNQYNRIKRK
jgi:hypothetical protein